MLIETETWQLIVENNVFQFFYESGEDFREFAFEEKKNFELCCYIFDSLDFCCKANLTAPLL